MGNKATTVEEQIVRLQERGMTIDCSEEKVKEILLDIGYYRLGFYWHPFEVDENHNFIEGTKFSDAVALYYLDSDLRNIFTKFLNRIEINFKTKLIYEVSNYYKTKPTWFADPSIMKNDFISQLPQQYDEKFKANNKAIKAHHNKYINDIFAPAWKTLEFMPFGSILYIYKNIKNEELQKRISNKYGVRNHYYFINHITKMIHTRNLCAHGGQLYDLKLPSGIISLYNLKFSNKERVNLKGICRLMGYYLSQISSNRQNDFEMNVKNIVKENCKNLTLKKIIETKSGMFNV